MIIWRYQLRQVRCSLGGISMSLHLTRIQRNRKFIAMSNFSDVKSVHMGQTGKKPSIFGVINAWGYGKTWYNYFRMKASVSGLFKWWNKNGKIDGGHTFQDWSCSQKKKRTTERTTNRSLCRYVLSCSKAHNTKLVPLLSFSVLDKCCYRTARKTPYPNSSFSPTRLVCNCNKR